MNISLPLLYKIMIVLLCVFAIFAMFALGYFCVSAIINDIRWNKRWKN